VTDPNANITGIALLFAFAAVITVVYWRNRYNG
jgi:hypothetical protein